MKDPLQKEQTPYEALGVGRGASAAEIEAAFRQGLAKRGNVQKLTAAKLALQRPLERATLDLFQYDSGVLSRLRPNPMETAGVLELPQREATAAAWDRQLRASFPDAGLAHSLALLWYWWAVSEEDRCASTEGSAEAASQAGASLERWERAIAFWGMVVATEEFWSGPGGFPNELISALRTGVVDRIRNQTHDLGQRYRGHQMEEVAGKYQELEVTWSTELRTAKDVASAGLRTSRGKITCGRLLLQQLGLLETVRKQVEAALAKNPAHARLKSLQSALSPYSSIAVMIEHKKLEAALEAIARLEKEEQGKEEVRRLRALAFYELGKQQTSLGKVVEAFESWEQALGRVQITTAQCPTCGRRSKEETSEGSYWCSWCGVAFVPRDDERQPAAGGYATGLEDLIKSEIVTTCQSKAASLQQHQPKEAITLLKKALKLVSDEKLQLTLAEILTQQGIQAMNEAQRRLESERKGVTPEIMAALESGLADLKQAAQLGSKRAAENVEIAQNVLQQAKSGLLDVSPEVGKLLRQANEEASADRWNEAIELMRKALRLARGKAQAPIKKQLAQILNARAVRAVNAAMYSINSAMETHQPQIDKKVKDFLAGRSSGSGAGGAVIVGVFVAAGIFLAIAQKYKLPKLVEIIASLIIVIPFLFYGIPAIVSFLGDLFKTATQFSYSPYGQRSTPCKLCSAGASYQINLPGHGECALCSTHADELRAILNGAPRIDSLSLTRLTSAERDLEEAYSLDSSVEGMTENRQHVREMLKRFSGSSK